MSEPRPLVSTSELAEALGLSVRTVQRLIKSGAITPAITIPGRERAAKRFDVESVKRELAQRRENES